MAHIVDYSHELWHSMAWGGILYSSEIRRVRSHDTKHPDLSQQVCRVLVSMDTISAAQCGTCCLRWSEINTMDLPSLSAIEHDYVLIEDMILDMTDKDIICRENIQSEG